MDSNGKGVARSRYADRVWGGYACARTSDDQREAANKEDEEDRARLRRRDEQSQVANRADRVSRRVDRPRLPSPVALVSPPRFAAPVPCPGSPLPVSGAPAKLRKANYTPPHPTFPRLSHSCAVSRPASSTSDHSGPRPPRPARCRRTWCDSGLDVCAPPAPGLGLRSIRPHRQSIGGEPASTFPLMVCPLKFLLPRSAALITSTGTTSSPTPRARTPRPRKRPRPLS